MRNDSILLTGMNSGTVSKVDRERMARQKKEKQERLSKKQVIQPAIEPVLLEIDKEKKRTILELMESIDTASTEQDLKSTIVALNLYKKSLDKLSIRLKNIMRVDIKKEKK